MKKSNFIRNVRRIIPRNRLYTDALRTLAWGTDAGFYRLVPKMVVRAENESEVVRLLQLANEQGEPVTFRAAGTSLSGQAISDSVLVVAGKSWQKYSLNDDGTQITLQPGLIGGRVNQILKPFGRKFGPDPASIQSAMVGGILMNNASGMNCGTHENGDKTLISARMVLADGTVLDTGDRESRNAFEKSHPEFLQRLEEIREKILRNPEIADRIRKKYRIKNVMGLNMLPFVRFSDPFEIMAHLLIGSEGTLAFLSEATLRTVAEYPCKASAMLYFRDMKEACRAVVAMKKGPVFSAELLDKKSLASVHDSTGENLTAILTETFANSKEELDANIRTVTEILSSFETVTPVHFTDKEEEYAPYWKIRAGIFPAVGGTRELGTTCLIEDVAFPIEKLPEAAEELQTLLAHHKYDDACIYGHALEGNFHFIINQKFDSEAEIERYENLMRDVIHLVVDKYDGSLKAEHGTGRNMAPFVAYEWGEAVFALMRDVKTLFDPKNLLNPGVIFNDDPRCYLQNLKPLPRTNDVVDRCIECGFCEVNCMSCGFTLSSRQRIVVQREISRLKTVGKLSEVARFQKLYRYSGNKTCAGDGLCSTSCPMGINVGEMTHHLREVEIPPQSWGYQMGKYCAEHFSSVKRPVRGILRVADCAHVVLGTKVMSGLCRALHKSSFRLIPLWTSAMPRAFSIPKQILKEDVSPDVTRDVSEVPTVVYFPSCLNQTFGTSRHAPDSTPLAVKTKELLEKSGYRVVFPENMQNLCCGTIWESKGMPEIANQKAAELGAALRKASENGKFPVLCDQSPCLYRMRETIDGIELYEPAEFIEKFLVPRLEFHSTERPVAIHITCSMRKMKLDGAILALARRCAKNVVVPENVGCCGFAGDKGFTQPELNAYGLRNLKPQLELHEIPIGYSNSRTCEIGLMTNGGIPYESIVYLVDECTTRKSV